MEDTARNNLVIDLAKLLDLHNGGDTTVLDIRGQSSWTDYFIITTATSSAHMQGLYRIIKGFLSEHDVEPLRRRKHVSDDNWLLVDCGDFVVHVMTEKTRSFYELERLWFEGLELYHSSKSS